MGYAARYPFVNMGSNVCYSPSKTLHENSRDAYLRSYSSNLVVCNWYLWHKYVALREQITVPQLDIFHLHNYICAKSKYCYNIFVNNIDLSIVRENMLNAAMFIIVHNHNTLWMNTHHIQTVFILVSLCYNETAYALKCKWMLCFYFV